jgi:mannan endo-1,4-beta-mannosidase
VTGLPPTTRRGALAALGAGAALLRARAAAGAEATVTLRLEPKAEGPRISPLVFGTNDFGTMGGGVDSAVLDREAFVGLRRLGGNAVATYNWTNGANNAGSDWYHGSGFGLPAWYLDDEAERRRPHSAVSAVHERARAVGARSLVQVQLGRYVAADGDGPVTPAEAAPSPRWVPVSWHDSGVLEPEIRRDEVNLPQMIRRLVDRYGPAAAGGIHAYALDNEPALWHETHPRAHPERMPIREFLRRSTRAAARIKAIDPSARVIGPAFWGSTGMVDFHAAPDWPRWGRRYGTMVAAYLDAFRQAEQRTGRRLLDDLDVHWYAYSDDGDIYNSRDPALAAAVLDAPRTLTEPGYVERSWVGHSIGRWPVDGLGLPILPSLRRLIERWYPGTGLAVTEFNYGHLPESTLATADALCRFIAQGVTLSAFWGRLEPRLVPAYGLFRDPRGPVAPIAGVSMRLRGEPPPELTVIAAHATDGAARRHVVAVNRGPTALRLDLRLEGERMPTPSAATGFDLRDGEIVPFVEAGPAPAVVPGFAARHWSLG